MFRRARCSGVTAATMILVGAVMLPVISQADTPQGQASPKATSNANSRLLAAAEPFEALTERSFSAKRAQLVNLVAKAEQSATKVTELLPLSTQGELNKQLGEIKAAVNNDQRSELALASVESYRILVSATQGTKVPTAVSLLDYSGFRYDADLKSNPSRWADMTASVDFAKHQWASISGDIKDNKLQIEFSDTLRNMENAVASKSAVSARRAVTSELNLVDKLEAYFNHG